MGIFSLKKKKANKQGKSAIMNVKSFSGFNFLSDDAISTLNTLSITEQQKIMGNMEVIYACVRYTQMAFQSGKVKTKVKKAKKWETVEESSIELAFRNNPALPESLIKQYQMGHLCTTGKSFLWIDKMPNGDVNEIYPIPPQWVKIITADKDNKGNKVISHYEINPSGSNVGDDSGFILGVDELSYTRIPALENLWDCIAPVNTIANKIKQEQMSDEFTQNAMQQLNTPAIIVKTQKPLNPTQKNDLKQILTKKLGKNMADSAFHISGDNASVDMLNPMKEFQWGELHDLNETRICMAFGLPPLLINSHVSLKESSGWASNEIIEARKGFYRSVIMPYWDMIGDDITRIMYTPEQRSTFKIFYDYSEVLDLQSDMKEAEDRAIKLFNASLISLNEAREVCGFSSLSKGDVIKSALNTVYQDINDDFTPDLLPPVDEGAVADVGGGTPASDTGAGQSPTVD